jgi:nitrogen fixation/metabolism regulation signal transduction histidine kinase
MKGSIFQGAGGGAVSLVSIVLLYLLLIGLILGFAGQLFTEITGGLGLSRFILLPLGIGFPLILLLTVGFQIYRLFREKRRGQPGIRFKIRLVAFFSFIAVLSSVPQGILSVSFLRTAMESWFSSRISTALESGLDIAMEYNSTRVQGLERFTESGAVAELVGRYRARPDILWEELDELYPHLDAVELYNAAGDRLYYRGAEAAALGVMPEQIDNGLLPRARIGDTSIIRTIRTFETDQGAVALVLGVAMPEGFDRRANEITGALQTFRQYRRFQNTFFLVVIVFYSLFSFPILLLSILVGFLLSEEIIRPVVHLENAIQRVISGDYSFRILTRSKDELSVLVSSFNTMVSELEQSRTKLRQTEKVTAWQEIAQRMAHEIKNPLTPIKLSAQRIERAYQQGSPKTGEIIQGAVASISDEINKLNQLLAEFRDFARLPEPNLQATDVAALLQRIAETYSSSYRNVSLDLSGLQPHTVYIDPNQMSRVFSNLLKNGFESIKGKGEISLRSDLVRKGHSHYCRIQIEDSGSGIPGEIEEQVFHPYYTTKEHGTGLGLPIVERIVSDHRGEIWFESEEGVGTTFFIDLPAEQVP